jgi:hypothetical protein
LFDTYNEWVIEILIDHVKMGGTINNFTGVGCVV